LTTIYPVASGGVSEYHVIKTNLTDVPELLALTVNIYNINEGRNGEILRRGKSLGEYAAFIGRVKGNRAKGLSLSDAITEAVEYCIFIVYKGIKPKIK
jgi:hypothetical protein